MIKKHWAIFIDNTSRKAKLIDTLLGGNLPDGFEKLGGLKGTLFSKLAVERFIEEEDRHDKKVITPGTAQSLKTMSSGEQKKALLDHILKTDSGFIVLDNPFDNLDVDAQADLKEKLREVARHTALIQLLSRTVDLLPFMNVFAKLEENRLVFFKNRKNTLPSNDIGRSITNKVPRPLTRFDMPQDILIKLHNVNVTYYDKPILKNIDWTIKKGQFWELRGKNGSGKTTILSMITGENPKGYGQELYIFGRKKGSGESVWEIKKRIGYFTPAMTDKFRGYHSVENMIISGITDSIGLYVRPTEGQLRLAREWLELIGLLSLKETLYHNLTMGQKRLVMCARAMIKHPPLLILDEPTAGLDDASATLFVSLVNKFARESETAVIFVSHRKEPDLRADHIYQLEMTTSGSVGGII